MITTLDQKHESRSEKYKVAATKEIAAKFKQRGFVVDDYIEAKVRKPGRAGYQKHMVRLSNPSLTSTHKDIKLQLLVTNSHDGSTSFKIQLGFFRFVCSNGMIVGDTFESISLRHSGSIHEEVDNAIDRIVAQAGALDAALTRMKEKTLSTAQIKAFTEEAFKLRDIANPANIRPLRDEDEANDLFTVYNRVQEALIQGGSYYQTDKGKTRKLRGVSNIGVLSKVNEGLFDIAMRLAA